MRRESRRIDPAVAGHAGRAHAAHLRWAALLVLAAGCAAGVARADDLPSRKAGLWEISIVSDGSPAQNAKHCIDEKTDRTMQEMGKNMGSQCTKQSSRREGDKFVGESECKFGGTTISSRSVTSGDVNSALRTEVDAKYSPPMAGKTTSKTVVTAKWAGACPAGWKPGDMEMAGMGRINVETMMKMGKPGGK